MKLINLLGLIFVTLLIFLAGCDSPTGIDEEKSLSVASISEELAKSNFGVDNLHATGEFWAKWQGCDGDHETQDDHTGGCSGDHEDGTTHDDSEECEGGHSDGDHGDEGGQGARPARDFYLKFNTKFMKNVKGIVEFKGLKDYEGIDFNGPVTWIQAGKESNEIVFGGEISIGTVNRGCFLISIQDNGEGKNMAADRLQYRLYGSSNAPCHLPDHFPKGFPIALYDGNLQVH
jgi:hypothetical protein